MSARVSHRGVFSLLVLLIAAVPAGAQEPAAPSVQYFYAVESLADGSVVRRGDFVLERDPATGRLRGGGIPANSLILAPETSYRYWLLEGETLDVGFAELETPRSGVRFTIPAVRLAAPLTPDPDGDGLHDDAEFIVGTDAAASDTDGDGISDGAELAQGLDPLDGVPARTGVVASADTPGTAIDVSAVNDIAIVADSQRGISVFNVFNGMDPLIIAQVETPGTALRVAHAGVLAAVADGEAGVAVVDLTDPPAAQVIHQVDLESDAQAVAVAGGIAYVGVEASELVSVDLATGTLLDRVPVPAAITDLAFDRDHLYLVSRSHLHVVSFEGSTASVVASVASPIVATGIERVFVGGGFVHTVHGKGYNTFRLEDPEAPVLERARDTTQFGWKQIVFNGSGLGLAAVGTARAFDGPHHVSLYDTGDPTAPEVFVTEFPTPSVARAVSIYNGLAYVADHTAGLQVINYLAHDTGGVPPTIALATSFAPGVAEEGSVLRVTASVGDDVQVRNVEFHVDGVRAFTDGNFPFEYRFVTPRIAEQPSFTLRARASDTGGNATWTDEMQITLVPDATAPRVLRVSPPDGSFRAGLRTVVGFLSEPLDPETVTSETFALSSDAGPVVGSVEHRGDIAAVFLSFEADLEPGVYSAALTTGLTDAAGNALPETYSWSFTVYDIEEGDSDGDCLADPLEVALGLDPALSDSDADGTLDGDEDSDGDGLANCHEVLSGLDAGSPDTDGDGLSDGAELLLGTDPHDPDTDRDGFLDGDEADLGSDPLDASSAPVDPDATIGYAVAAVGFSVANEVVPASGETVREAVVAGVVSVANEIDPTGEEIRETTSGFAVSVANQANPTGEPIREAVSGVAVSVSNENDPTGDAVREATAPVLSVENTSEP